MKINQIKANQTEIIINSGKIVFCSYNTPVAACVDGTYYRTSKKWSNTTSKHVNSWLDGVKAEEKEQSFFDDLLK
jgi:hypothetical protein